MFRFRLIGIAVGIAAILPAGASAAMLVVQNARLVDGTDAPSRGPVSILIRDGRIVEVAARIDPKGASILDVAGATVIPGLIDAHVHLASVPGADVRGDPPARRRFLRQQHLRSYLACGVTTVLDAATDIATAREVQQWLASGHPGPTVLTLGPPIAAPGGYMSGMEPGVVVAAPEDVERAFAAIAGVGAVGVKVPIERGFAADTVFPIHSPAVRAAITREAAKRALPIYVHASDETEQTIGLDMGAHALMHTNFAGVDPSPEFVEHAARSGAYMVTTFSIIDAGLARWEPERLDDPLWQLTVPIDERRTALSAEAWAARDRMELTYAFPRLPATAVGFLAWLSPPRHDAEVQALATNLRAARRLHAAGVPLPIGSDAGNNSLLSQFHGPSTLREIELLVTAGVSATNALSAATRIAAQMLGIGAEVGTIEPGKRGDMVVLNGDPTADIRAIRAIRWTIKNGIARTPDQWMDVSATDESSANPDTAVR